jgi:signal transduction histidine kinase
MEAADEALNGGDIAFTADVPADMIIESDPEHLYRISANLLRNAAEAINAAAGPARQIRITLDTGALVFRDTGPGMPEKARENLFKPFAGSSRANGTGLGLVIAHELAAALGGELTLQETGETGTAFRLALPGLKP